MKLRVVNVVFLIIFLALTIFQIKTTNFKSAYSFTPHEVDLQIKRMNMYPPVFARLGHLLEVKKEVQIIKKLESNFFTVFDFNEYFPNRIPFIFSPFLFVGIYIFIKEREKRKIMFYGFILTLILSVFIGPYAKYGPVSMMLFLIYFIALGLAKILKFKWL